MAPQDGQRQIVGDKLNVMRRFTDDCVFHGHPATHSTRIRPLRCILSAFRLTQNTSAYRHRSGALLFRDPAKIWALQWYIFTPLFTQAL
ncbi:MAG: hypothetical protein ABIO31_05655 [Candidatus Nitrotoga sp.]